MRKTSKRWLAMMALLCLSLTTEAQIESRLTYRRYTIQDGLPQMQTERVWQDSRGYIYIGTLSGFVRFDGRTFTPFLKGRRENIVGFTETGGQVRALSFARQWIVDCDEVTPQLFDPQKRWFLNNFNAGSLTGDYVLMENEQEENRRLCRMTQEGFKPVLKGALLDEMTPDRKLFIDSACVYVPTERGLFRVSGSHAVMVSAKKDIYTLLRTDSALLAFAADGIYCFEERGVRSEERLLLKADWSEATFGLTVRMTKSGSLVIADEHTVYVYDGHSLSKVIDGINLIKDLLVDRWDRLWVATYQGLYCLFNRNFTNHRLTDQNDIARAVAADGQGHMVIGTLNGKVLFRGEGKEESGKIICEDQEQFYAPNAARIGSNVYMVGHGDVACIANQSDGQEKASISWLGLPKDRYQFVAAVNDRLIVGSRKGVMAYHPATGSVDTLSMEILHPWCAAADAKGCLWIGSSPGLYSISPDGSVAKTNYRQKLIITTMTADTLGHILFASADSLFMIHDGQVAAMSQQIPALSGHEIRSLHVSPQGFLVIAVLDGLFVCRIDHDCHLSDVRFYDHRNGFTALEPQMATMAETPDGTIWLAGIEEMTSFHPKDLYAYSEEDTYIAAPLKWWQHWWVWVIGLLLLSLALWIVARCYEHHRSRKEMIRLQQEKLQREKQIRQIRQKAKEAEPNELAHDIVKMTEGSHAMKIALQTINGTVIVEVTDIAYFKADGNYTQMITFHGSEMIIKGIGSLMEKTLDQKTFIRADRSTVVNIHNIARLIPRERRCIFHSPSGQEVETTLLAPAFKRLETFL
ncbi:MAG: LytTR family transcriptional regulator DNA-binding domain-containing protein [Prevotella sp.]|nr:LytTR family transcriptional regulator DNA-binding domain-containing protein [Prevotella sp.]MBQ9650589.1 LytTR family transcriptional regulator DNA-binding domain-containing protein [Prevotella sp.]